VKGGGGRGVEGWFAGLLWLCYDQYDVVEVGVGWWGWWFVAGWGVAVWWSGGRVGHTGGGGRPGGAQYLVVEMCNTLTSTFLNCHVGPLGGPVTHLYGEKSTMVRWRTVRFYRAT